MQKKVKVEGVEYTLQHPGAYWYLQCIDRNKNQFGVLQVSTYSKDLMETVVVQPKVSFEDFPYDAVTPSLIVSEIENFLNTKQTRPEEDRASGES